MIKMVLSQPGINLCWGTYLNTNQMKPTVNQIEKDGYKVVRIWLCRWGIKGLWHQEYIPEQPNSALDLDNLSLFLQMCHKFDIKVILTIIPHAHFLTISRYEVENPQDAWLGNPFRNISRTPYQFFSDAKVRLCFKNFLGYLYKIFPANALPWSIELWNEVDMIANLPGWLVVDWHRQMLNLCKTLNSKVLLTTSTAVPDSLSDLFSLDSLDAISLHNYRFPYSSAIANLCYWKNSLSRFGKQLWLTEFDFNSQKAIRNAESRTYLQTALVAAPCLGYQIGPCFWWWESTLGHKILPQLALSKVCQWLTTHQNHHLVDLITANYCDRDQDTQIKSLNFLGKTRRYLVRKLFHKTISLFSSCNNILALQSGNNFLVLVEASKINPVYLRFKKKAKFSGICYNLLDGQTLTASIFNKDNQTYWLAQCVQILIIQKK